MPTVVQSLGTLKELNVDLWPKSSRSLTLYDNYTYAYQTIYKTQAQVGTVVDFLGRNLAQIGIHLYRRISDTDRERLTAHPLAAMLDRPNDRTTGYDLIDATVQDRAIFGDAYWLKLPRGASQPRQLLRLPPQYVTVEGGMEPTKYTLSVGQSFDFAPSELVHFKNYNPDSQIRGLSPLEKLRRVLAEEHASSQWREGFWKNGAHISGYIERPADAPAWSEAERERFLTGFRALYSGVENGGGVPLIEDGMAFKEAAFNSQENEYLLGRKLTREEVVASYHVPLPMAGILDHATFSNIEEQHRNLYQDCLMPWCESTVQTIMLQLLPDFADTDGVYLEFNIAAKLQGSFEQQATALQTAVGGPWMLRSEARARMNLPAVPGFDEPITPLNVTQGGQASPRDSGSQNKAAAIARIVDRQARVLGSNGGKYDQERWKRELAEDLEAIG